MKTRFERVVVLDFEATCVQGGAPVPQEVIEFPSVLVSLSELRVLDHFGTFVRPVHHPQLSEFCTELTGIRQDDVDPAPTFSEALALHQAWLASHQLIPDGESFAFVTCGDWDLATMLPVQCKAAGIAVPSLPRAYRRWINIKKPFVELVRGAKSHGMPSMLRALNLELEGRHHRGLDDCHNIARIALALAAKGAKFEITGRLSSTHYPELPLELQSGDRVERVVLKKYSIASLLGLASGLFRGQIVAVHTEGGAPLTDDDALTELPAGTRLLAIGKPPRA
jgi:inhibitor of KinA sporulation pathway (predicted exonuclease)